MKLLRLHIDSKYGSLNKGFKLEFIPDYANQINSNLDWNEFHPYCFAGLNGSGKSNVLEVLANIFYHIESCANVNQPENFQDNFKPEISKPNAFRLEYFICQDKDYKTENLIKVCITKKEKDEKEDGIPLMTYQPFPFIEDPIPVSVVAEKYAENPSPAKRYLPNLIIGYSSGENEILSIPFLKTRLLHYDEYRVALEKKSKYEEPESSLLYIDYEMSQAVLLTNLLFQDKKVLDPLRDELGIEDIIRFRMNLNLHFHDNKSIIEQYQDVINAFKRCATSSHESKDKLTLDFWINTASKKAFRRNFPKGVFQLFQAFQILYTLNYRTVKPHIKLDVYQSKGFYTDGKVPVPEPEEKVFFFLDYYIRKRVNEKEHVDLLLKNLSDGEQQFLHSLGICLMLKDRNALLLLDEPETHFNPGWRSKFIRTLKNSLEASNSNNLMRDILITSHSPFIISDCFPDKVLIFDRDDDGKVFVKKAEELGIHTFGTSNHIITNKVFRKKETIADYSLELLNKYKDRFESGESIDELITEINIIHGDSIEKLLLINELKGIQKK